MLDESEIEVGSVLGLGLAALWNFTQPAYAPTAMIRTATMPMIIFFALPLDSSRVSDPPKVNEGADPIMPGWAAAVSAGLSVAVLPAALPAESLVIAGGYSRAGAGALAAPPPLSPSGPELNGALATLVAVDVGAATMAGTAVEGRV